MACLGHERRASQAEQTAVESSDVDVTAEIAAAPAHQLEPTDPATGTAATFDRDVFCEAAPNEIAGDVATVVDLLSEWQQVMTEAEWTLRLADIKDVDRGSYMRIEDFAYDTCEGPWSRASELTPPFDEVRASDEWAGYVSTYVTLDFTMDEAECLATASITIEMTSLLGAYGFCGIEFDRFLALAGS